MERTDKLINVWLVVGFLILFKTFNAYAYIDPGIGSYIFQLLIAGLVGASFLIKVFWRRIKNIFKKYVLREPVEEDE